MVANSDCACPVGAICYAGECVPTSQDDCYAGTCDSVNNVVCDAVDSNYFVPPYSYELKYTPEKWLSYGRYTWLSYGRYTKKNKLPFYAKYLKPEAIV